MPDIFPDAVSHIYAQNRAASDGAVSMAQFAAAAQWSGPGSVTFKTNVQAAGRYEAALCCSVLVDEADVRLTVSGCELAARIGKTRGVWTGDKLDHNFERVHLPGVLDLAEGPAAVTVSLAQPLPEKSFSLCSIELTPVAAKKEIEKVENEGLALKANTDWFVRAGYGLMFHWAAGVAPPRGPVKHYAEAVRNFDVAAWAQMCEDTGAGYVFLTANHGQPHFPAPLKYWGSVHPGLTTERDLVAEMAEALERRQMRLALYLNCPTFAGLRSPPKTSLEEYRDSCCRMFEEVGGRYGEHVAAYWLDSWYQPFVLYGRFPIQEVFRAAKAGCRDRLVAFNHWAFPIPTLCQEYWAAEFCKTLGHPPADGCYEAGAAKGLQGHALLAVDCDWLHTKTDTEMEPPVWSGEVLAEYIRRYIDHRSVVTVNLGIFQDGTIGPRTAEVMRKVRKSVRG